MIFKVYFLLLLGVLKIPVISTPLTFQVDKDEHLIYGYMQDSSILFVSNKGNFWISTSSLDSAFFKDIDDSFIKKNPFRHKIDVLDAKAFQKGIVVVTADNIYLLDMISLKIEKKIDYKKYDIDSIMISDSFVAGIGRKSVYLWDSYLNFVDKVSILGNFVALVPLENKRLLVISDKEALLYTEDGIKKLKVNGSFRKVVKEKTESIYSNHNSDFPFRPRAVSYKDGYISVFFDGKENAVVTLCNLRKYELDFIKYIKGVPRGIVKENDSTILLGLQRYSNDKKTYGIVYRFNIKKDHFESLSVDTIGSYLFQFIGYGKDRVLYSNLAGVNIALMKDFSSRFTLFLSYRPITYLCSNKLNILDGYVYGIVGKPKEALLQAGFVVLLNITYVTNIVKSSIEQAKKVYRLHPYTALKLVDSAVEFSILYDLDILPEIYRERKFYEGYIAMLNIIKYSILLFLLVYAFLIVLNRVLKKFLTSLGFVRFVVSYIPCRDWGQIRSIIHNTAKKDKKIETLYYEFRNKRFKNKFLKLLQFFIFLLYFIKRLSHIERIDNLAEKIYMLMEALRVEKSMEFLSAVDSVFHRITSIASLMNIQVRLEKKAGFTDRKVWLARCVDREKSQMVMDILFNLILNAMEAQKEVNDRDNLNYEVKVEIDLYLHPQSAYIDEDYIISIVIKDFGDGIKVKAKDEYDRIEKIFKSGYTGKEKGRGEGLTDEKLEFAKTITYIENGRYEFKAIDNHPRGTIIVWKVSLHKLSRF